jgi:integrase
MELLTVPKKHSRCGIKVKCLKCKFQISNQCRLNSDKKSIRSCEYKDKHRFNLVTHVPNTISARRMKIIETKDFDTALVEMVKFKEELQNNCYQKVTIIQEKSTTKLLDFIVEYLDMLNGVNTPKHLIRVRSKDHIADVKRTLERFCKALKEEGYKLESLDITNIRDYEVEHFHNYLLDDLELGECVYNRSFINMKAFFNWINDVKDFEVKNPFAKAELRFEQKEVSIIKKEEFKKLLSVITEENSIGYESGKRLNFYRNWLKFGFQLGLETGVRTKELVRMRWSDLIEIEKDIWVFKINNGKVNEIQTGKESGNYVKYIPLTKSLKEVLVEMGYDTKKYSRDYLLQRENNESIEWMESCLSRGFSHFIKFATDRKLTFKHLRKTYITMLTMQVGDKAKLLTGHTNNETIKNHYLSAAYGAASLNNFEIFK